MRCSSVDDLGGRGAGCSCPARRSRSTPASRSGVVVLLRDDAADDDDDLAAALLRELVDELGHERLVPRGLARDADDVHVVLDRLARGFGRRLEQRADVDVEAEVGERGGDHLGAAVVAVLAELGDEDARPPAFRLRERVDRGCVRSASSSAPSYAPP